MKKFYFFLIATAALFLVNLSVAQESMAFIHTADANSILTNRTIIDEPHTNNQTSIYPIFTHNFNPNGSVGLIYVTKNQGMYYASNKWRIFNQDLSAFTANSSYNVMVPSADAISWTHKSKANNISFNQTEIDHPAINGDSLAVVMVSSMWESNYLDKVIGVYYKKSSQKWNIFIEDGLSVPMPVDIEFNVVVAKSNKPQYEGIQVKATVSNTLNHVMKIDHPDLNGNPNAIVFATHNYNVAGGTGKYNNHQIGVYYDGSNWTVFNEDYAFIEPGVGFNILFFHNKNISVNENHLNTSDVKLFPNPVEASGTITIQLENSTQGDADIKLYNTTGVCVMQKHVESNRASFSEQLTLPDLNRGIYILKIEQNGKVGTQKLFVR